MMVHACIQMPITSALFDRFNMMTTIKYNVSGHYFSIIDIEHGVLRARSSKPAIFGPIVASFTFSDRDKRKVFALKSPWPLISFAIFYCSSTSPAITVLKKASTITSELSKCAMNFIQEYVSIERHPAAFRSTHTVSLPAVFKTYWKDFGQKQNDVLTFIGNHAPPTLAYEIKFLLSSGSSYALVFGTHDWQPLIIL
jgi:hypothetical protein